MSTVPLIPEEHPPSPHQHDMTRYRVGVYPEGKTETEVLFGYRIEKMVAAVRNKCQHPDDNFWYSVHLQVLEGLDYRSELVGEYHATAPVDNVLRDVRIFEETFREDVA